MKWVIWKMLQIIKTPHICETSGSLAGLRIFCNEKQKMNWKSFSCIVWGVDN